MDQNGIDSNLLARYVAGEANALQRAQVEAWVRLDALNAQELDRWQRIWSYSVAGYEARTAEERAWAQGAEAERRAWALGADAEAKARLMEDRAWAKVQGRIGEAEGTGRVIPLGRVHWQRWLAAAAMVTGIVFAVRWFLQPKTETYLAEAEAVEARLADNSAVTLSPGTEISVRMGDERKVTLSGKAYFEVQRDEQRPFVIDAGELRVVVLGTAFEVSAYDTAGTIAVRVRSGRVRVDAAGDTAELTAGQRVVFNRKRHELERALAPPAEVWGLRVLQFEGAALAQVVEQLQRIYKVRIDLGNEAVARCRLTAEFDDEPIERILRVIADTFSLELTRTADGFTLDGDGC